MWTTCEMGAVGRRDSRSALGPNKARADRQTGRWGPRGAAKAARHDSHGGKIAWMAWMLARSAAGEDRLLPYPRQPDRPRSHAEAPSAARLDRR